MNQLSNLACRCTNCPGIGCPGIGCQCGCAATQDLPTLNAAAAACACGTACGCDAADQGCVCPSLSA